MLRRLFTIYNRKTCAWQRHLHYRELASTLNPTRFQGQNDSPLMLKNSVAFIARQSQICLIYSKCQMNGNSPMILLQSRIDTILLISCQIESTDPQTFTYVKWLLKCWSLFFFKKTYYYTAYFPKWKACFFNSLAWFTMHKVWNSPFQLFQVPWFHARNHSICGVYA